MKKPLLYLLILLVTVFSTSCSQSSKETFEIGDKTFLLNGKPFVVKAAEIHYPRIPKEYWEHRIKMCKALGMNTICLYVFWNFHEPEEGKYDFTGQKDIAAFCRLAQENGMYVIVRPGPYVCAEWEMGGLPWWLLKKKDIRLREADPYFIERVNIFEQEVARQVGGLTIQNGGPIIMVQVENEVGLLGTERDYCRQAEEAFTGNVPDKLMDAAVKSGKIRARETGWPEKADWTVVFGEDAGEIFSAWFFASALERIASVGKKEYPLPCYANVWLKQFPWYAGSYPSGGPVEDMLWVWKAAAPSLFTIAPDIYVPYVSEIMEKYTRPDNPLVIPEVRKDAVTASYALYAYLNCHALCYAPFGIEDLWQKEPDVIPKEVTEALNIDPLSFDMTGTKETLGEVYRLLGEIKSLYLRYRGTTHLKCFLKNAEGEQGCYLKFKSYDMEIRYLPQQVGMPTAAGAVFELDENNFLIVGMMCNVCVHTKPGDHRKVDFIRKEAGTYSDGQWRCRQRQNGDEKIVTMLYDMPECVKMELFKY